MRYTACLLLLCGCLHPVIGKMLDLPAGCTAWTPLPMRVSIAPNAWRYYGDVVEAINTWNKALGVTALVLSDDRPQILVVSGMMETETEKGYTDYQCLDKEVVSTVFVNSRLVWHQSDWVVVHEFGHALGLGHSTNSQSVMQAGVNSEGWYRVTEGDVDMFRRVHRGDPVSLCHPVKRQVFSGKGKPSRVRKRVTSYTASGDAQVTVETP